MFSMADGGHAGIGHENGFALLQEIFCQPAKLRKGHTLDARPSHWVQGERRQSLGGESQVLISRISDEINWDTFNRTACNTLSRSRLEDTSLPKSEIKRRIDDPASVSDRFFENSTVLIATSIWA